MARSARADLLIPASDRFGDVVEASSGPMLTNLPRGQPNATAGISPDRDVFGAA
jgi:hypothetical protein